MTELTCAIQSVASNRYLFIYQNKVPSLCRYKTIRKELIGKYSRYQAKEQRNILKSNPVKRKNLRFGQLVGIGAQRDTALELFDKNANFQISNSALPLQSKRHHAFFISSNNPILSSTPFRTRTTLPQPSLFKTRQF